MFRPVLAKLLLALALSNSVATSLAAGSSAPDVGFAIIKTSQVAVREGMLVPGGSFLKQINSNFSAFLIKHRQDYLLFDTGMGRQIDGQYQQDMPMWLRLFFKYDHPVVSAREQLDKAGLPPLRRVILSHSHWDHASGVLDFPGVKIGRPPPAHTDRPVSARDPPIPRADPPDCRSTAAPADRFQSSPETAPSHPGGRDNR